MSSRQVAGPVSQLVERLRAADLDTARFVDVQGGSKVSGISHSYPSTGHSPDSVNGDYGVYGGGRLVILDVDEGDSEGTKAIDALPSTFTVKSPHASIEAEGHRYYSVEGDPVERLTEAFGKANLKLSWGEVRADNQYAVGPGSTLTDCKHGCCTPENPGRYAIANDVPIARITPDELVGVLSTDPELQERNEPDSTSTAKPATRNHEPLDYDESDVAAVNAALHDFRYDDRTTARAFEYVMDLLQGRYAKRGFEGDRSAAEECLASKLYGLLRFTDAVDNAERKIYACISEYVESHEYTDNGDVRKWLQRGTNYRRGTVQSAISTFDLETWQRFRHRRADGHEWNDEYGDITFDHVLKAIRTAYEQKPGYPSKRDVVDIAQELDPSRSQRSHETALSRLQTEYGQVKMAYLGGNRYVYYPAREPDPEAAEYVRLQGEEL
jgi:hypothetical protein